MKVLREAGADVNIKDKDGKTAIDYANNEEIKEILQQKQHKKQQQETSLSQGIQISRTVQREKFHEQPTHRILA